MLFVQLSSFFNANFLSHRCKIRKCIPTRFALLGLICCARLTQSNSHTSKRDSGASEQAIFLKINEYLGRFNNAFAFLPRYDAHADHPHFDCGPKSHGQPASRRVAGT